MGFDNGGCAAGPSRDFMSRRRFGSSAPFIRRALRREQIFGSNERIAHSTSGDRFALIRAIPRTGRTHQIRVHLASLGHAVVGDKIYGPDEQLYLRFIKTGWTAELAGRLLLPRHALHSATLELECGRKWISPLPTDLAGFVANCNSADCSYRSAAR